AADHEIKERIAIHVHQGDIGGSDANGTAYQIPELAWRCLQGDGDAVVEGVEHDEVVTLAGTQGSGREAHGERGGGCNDAGRGSICWADPVKRDRVEGMSWRRVGRVGKGVSGGNGPARAGAERNDVACRVVGVEDHGSREGVTWVGRPTAEEDVAKAVKDDAVVNTISGEV